MKFSEFQKYEIKLNYEIKIMTLKHNYDEIMSHNCEIRSPNYEIKSQIYHTLNHEISSQNYDS